ncbi:glucokinase [Clostridium saccharoperbutylacetonicum]|uniref:Glucokinase GlcK n=1 Tax=Clostridium saccharoperbutylacetonicum N1-4(HMT) TaxID=931276 RepID=M1MM53_9CLOT|nr:ROK family protein [Clostridium saccharoperbutylacetonicum]AGF59014.1 glucokinase GlcK [Clostridium saccharoperbutylacetonicum N1-4(HMT)]NRT60198.1 glucokinase [Clostridium saccharoperbutylacetonicum]NSB23510.1 glucokinase [Clostridium saccharoperbutylacetonicum]NSB42880.1 glucokinase [Clostridium saccharoperbutylacetonicum]
MSNLIGIDIGGTNLRAAVISKDGDIVEIFKVENEVEKGPTYNLDKLVNHIKGQWSNYEIEKVGVGVPGPLDLKEGKLLNPVNLKGWRNFNIKNYLSEKLNLPVKVNNDANVAGLAESLVGSAKNCESVFYITVSTGVGGALILENKIINGAHSQTAEIYNMIINEDRYSHSGANKGGLEGQCSGINIARIASEAYGKKLSTKEVFELYKSNDKKAVQVIENWIDNISIGIANIISVVDPETVVIGGAVLIYNTYLLPKIIECTKTKVADPSMVDIRIAEIGDNAGLIGAAML